MPFISFIVPVYNVQKYLPDCMESIVSQDFKDFEILLIDDHSNDGSESLCDQYAARDPRITTVHLPQNLGPGRARNEGLSRARGEYVYFIDGDDAITREELHHLCSAVERWGFPDLVHVGFCESFGWIDPWQVGNRGAVVPRALRRDDFLHPFLEKSRIGFQVWQLVYRRSLLADSGIVFSDARVCEDNGFALQCLFASRTVGKYENVFYHWRTRLSGSLTSAHVSQWHHIVNSAADVLQRACKDKLSALHRNWALRNAYSLLVQFEDVAGGIQAGELKSYSHLFRNFEIHMRYLEPFITERGLLWYIRQSGAEEGAARFYEYKRSEIRKALEGRADRHLYGFPATRRCSRLLSVFSSLGYRFRGLLDNDVKKQGLIFEGYVILNPEIIPLAYEKNDDLFVVISTYKRSTGAVLAEQLYKYGLREGGHFLFMEFEMD